MQDGGCQWGKGTYVIHSTIHLKKKHTNVLRAQVLDHIETLSRSSSFLTWEKSHLFGAEREV